MEDARSTSLPPVVQRFLRYVRIDTQSDPDSKTTPSTEKQKVLGRLLLEELRELGSTTASMDGNGYVYAVLPAVGAEDAPRLGLLAHLDTSPDEPGGARPIVHFDYDGCVLALPGNPNIRLDPETTPELLNHVGEHIITSDGTTLLGSDDKAGVAVLVQLAADLLADREWPRPEIHLCFTVDEEIGRGVEKIDMSRFSPDVAYTIDGGGTCAIYAETFNAAEAIVDIRGIMVHPGYARGVLVNALRILGRLIALLPPDEAPETSDGREGYVHPHVVGPSDPSHAALRLMLRDFTEVGLSRRKQRLASLVEFLRNEYPSSQILLEIKDQYKNMRTYIAESDPRALTFAHAAAARMGLTLEERLVRGGTDGARLSELGIPTPNVFNGGHNFHSRFEWNTSQSIELSLAYVKELVRYWGEYGHTHAGGPEPK